MSTDVGPDLTAQARKVLESWSVETPHVEPVTIGVNRRVWRTGIGFLTSSWPDERSMAEAELAVCQQVAATPGVRFGVPSPVATGMDQLIVEAFDRIWWLTRPVSGERPDPTVLDTLLAVSGSLAEVHHQLRGVDLSVPVQPRRLTDWISLAEEFLDQHADLFEPAQGDSVTAAIALVGDYAAVLSNDLQLVHGDPSFPNLLVDPESKRIVGVLDWQEAAFDSVLTDLSVLGNTIWQRSALSDRRSALDQCVHRYVDRGGEAFPSTTILIAMLAAKLQSVVHHGTRYLAGRGDWKNFAEQPELIAEILAEIGD